MHTKGLIRITTLVGLALLTAALLMLPSTALAKGKPQPLKLKGTTTLTPTEIPGVYTVLNVGQATYFGNYVNTGWFALMLDDDGNVVIAAGEGTTVAANGKDYVNWHMEPFTGRVILDGAADGRFAGAEGYFDSEIITSDPDAPITTWIGFGEITFAH
jgi:hypothetical protein